jgi:hypothetical protein
MLFPVAADQQFPRDRRTSLRIPLATGLRYRVLTGPSASHQGTGKVENISSKGLAFCTEEPLEPGSRLHVTMAWPAKLNDGRELTLMFHGVVQRAGRLVFATIERPAFRVAEKSRQLPVRSAVPSGIGRTPYT